MNQYPFNSSGDTTLNIQKTGKYFILYYDEIKTEGSTWSNLYFYIVSKGVSYLNQQRLIATGHPNMYISFNTFNIIHITNGHGLRIATSNKGRLRGTGIRSALYIKYLHP